MTNDQATVLRHVRRDRLILAIIGTVTMMNAVLQPAFTAHVMNSSVLLAGAPRFLLSWLPMDDHRIPAPTRQPVAV